nr:hypothetical protein [Ferrovum myxofaciens]
MNQASISRRASLTFPLTDSINCRATQSLPRWPDSSTNQERIGMVSAEPNRTRTTRASVTQPWLFKKGGPVGLVAVIVFDADPRPFLRATRNQRIVDNQVDQLVWKNSLRQLQQLNGQVGDRDIRPLDQFVVGGPVRLAANGSDGTSDPAFRVEHATDQKFDKGSAGTGWNGGQKKGNPFREQQTDRGGERHEEGSGVENPSLVAALPASKTTPSG